MSTAFPHSSCRHSSKSTSRPWGRSCCPGLPRTGRTGTTWTGNRRRPSGRPASLNPMGSVFFQPPVAAEDLGPQAESLGRAAPPALEETGKEGIHVPDLRHGDRAGRRGDELGAPIALRSQTGIYFLRRQTPTHWVRECSSLERISGGREGNIYFHLLTSPLKPSLSYPPHHPTPRPPATPTAADAKLTSPATSRPPT